MRGKNVFLEAPVLTQDMLNIKWASRSVGYSIASTWHEADGTRRPRFGDHRNANGIEQIQCCDLLVVIGGTGGNATPELAMMAGFAPLWIPSILDWNSDRRSERFRCGSSLWQP
jgi:hypothetical protein